MTSTSVQLKIIGADPDSITDALGIEPTRSWRKGDAMGKWTATHSGWVLHSGCPKQAHATHQIDTLLRVIVPIDESFIEATASFEKTLEVAVTHSGRNAESVLLTPEHVSRAAHLGLAIDVLSRRASR